uniref:NADP-dependent oxidoreductase n=1 Tax=Thaumasiovibrio occultus TaxID=1891184 RepID=UPI000B351461|nr:NADP-dependent oxidoreductase [Thaumasiovibrio occultus]
MKAFQLQEFGCTNIVDCPIPEPQADEILVRVLASSINPVDWKIASGMLAQLVQQPLPLTLGWDLAGEVIATGNDAGEFAIGERVFAMKAIGIEGTLAQYCVVKKHHLARLPDSVSYEQAGTVPMTLLTAWQALYEAGNLQPQQRVFIQAGAGGVGHMAIQLAKARQAHVVAATSTGNIAFLESLGADDVLDYTQQDIYQWLRDNPVDLVLESLHGDAQVECVAAIKPKGRLISISGLQPSTLTAAEQADVHAEFVFVQPNAEQLNQAVDLLASGDVVAHISQSVSFDEIEHGYQLSQTSRVRGKILVTFD